MYYRRYDFEITKREVLFSVIIFFVMLIIGVVSNSALTDHFIQKNDMYGKALKINAEESLFKQVMLLCMETFQQTHQYLMMMLKENIHIFDRKRRDTLGTQE